MIQELYIKNFALIREATVNFQNNLNILTGETGSGKSILIGSINLALGGRINKEQMINEDEDTIVCLTFLIKDEIVLEKIRQMDINIDDGKIIVYRKISKDRSISKVNDISCTLNKIKEVTELLVDIYGQHDSDDLRKENKHIDFLDDYIGQEVLDLKNSIKKYLHDYKLSKKELEKFNIDDSQKLREIDLLEYEIEELENADLKVGEEDELQEKYKLLSNSKNLTDSLNLTKNVFEQLDVSNAIRELKSASKIDSSIDNILHQALDIESLSYDLIKDVDNKIDTYDVDDENLNIISDRLSKIRNILNKYNNSVDNALNALKDKKNRLKVLNNYDIEKTKAMDNIDKTYSKLLSECDKLSKLRIKRSKLFEKDLSKELIDLGFLDVNFKIDFNKKSEPNNNGIDDVKFLISLNPGEKMRSISEVASGGELSRIMLSIKTILSNTIGTETLIFDEIDAGISGITASKVAVKLNKISTNHQVLCITHLPQIAAMADHHFVINKTTDENKSKTITNVLLLDYDGMINEIGRLISSNDVLTDTVKKNAIELKNNANMYK